MKKTIRFANTLIKGNIQYYFEIRDFAEFSADENCYMPAEEAYIEKTLRVGGTEADEHYGIFTIEEARKCYKALLNKGFKAEA